MLSTFKQLKSSTLKHTVVTVMSLYSWYKVHRAQNKWLKLVSHLSEILILLILQIFTHSHIENVHAVNLFYQIEFCFMYIAHGLTTGGKTLTSCFCYYYALWVSSWAVFYVCLPSINTVALAVFMSRALL